MSEESISPAMNPWWGIWVQPRQTIRYLAETDPRMHFWVLVVFYGIISAVESGITASLGDIFSPREVAAFILLAGPLSGVIGVYLTGGLLALVGKIFGGQAENQQIRMVLAWATLPLNMLIILGLLPLLAMVGGQVFSSTDPFMRQFLFGSGPRVNFLANGLMTWKLLVDVAGLIYYLTVAIVGFAEVQNFSIWKSVGTFFVVLGGILLSLMCLATIGLAA
jgi:hypothetical protein